MTTIAAQFSNWLTVGIATSIVAAIVVLAALRAAADFGNPLLHGSTSADTTSTSTRTLIGETDHRTYDYERDQRRRPIPRAARYRRPGRPMARTVPEKPETHGA